MRLMEDSADRSIYRLLEGHLLTAAPWSGYPPSL